MKGGKKMDQVTAVMICEGVEAASEKKQVEAWQLLVDTGLAWSLQGWFGRTAAALIQKGVIHR